jgi:hypothetical protein
MKRANPPLLRCHRPARALETVPKSLYLEVDSRVIRISDAPRGRTTGKIIDERNTRE